MRTKAISLREVIQDQTVDDTARKLPKDSEIGQVSWATPTPGNTKGKLLQSNSVLGMAHTFNSVQGCVPCRQSYINSMPPVPVGTYSTASFLMSFCVAYLSCDGSPTSGFNFDPPWVISWQSSNKNVATVAPNGYSATVFGVSPSSSNLNATVTFPEPGIYPPYTCPKTASGSVGVSPNLTSISPAQGPIGTTIPVTHNRTGLSAATVNAGSGITVTVTSRTNTQIQANFAISASAPAGNHAVSVAAGGQSSPTLNFFVQVPTKLVRTDFLGVPNGYGPLVVLSNENVVNVGGQIFLTSQCGMYRNLVYSLQDQQTPAFDIDGAYTLVEMFSNYTSTYGGTGPPTQNLNMTPGGLLNDIQYFGKTAPNCPGASDNESFTQSHKVVIGTSNYPLTTVNSIQRGNYSGAAHVDVTITTP